MKKKIMTIAITILFLNSYAQKKQMIILNYRIDSLTQILSKQRNDSINMIIHINELEKVNTLLKIKLNERDSLNNILTNSNIANKSVIEKKNFEINTLSQRLSHIENNYPKIDCSSVIGNSNRRYPVRVSGESNGCIGDDCEEIPSDRILHDAVLKLKTDFNGDSIIDVNDLPYLIEKTGDLNKDSKIDIYDIVFPDPIKTTSLIINPNVIIADSLVHSIIGIISKDGLYLNLQNPIGLIDQFYPGEGSNKVKTNKIQLAAPSNIIVYRNKLVVLKGKLLSGNTQTYENGFIFQVEEVVGKIN